ncbi:MAG: hypothetical protein AAF653_20645, partial [Chloroflexota bacterium]
MHASAVNPRLRNALMIATNFARTRTQHAPHTTARPAPFCWRRYRYPSHVEAFIRQYKLRQGIQPWVNAPAGGHEPQFAHLPCLRAADLTPNHIHALLANQAGHLDITMRHFLGLMTDGYSAHCYASILGLEGQLRLARYRFLNHPTHALLCHAREIEQRVLSHECCEHLRETF